MELNLKMCVGQSKVEVLSISSHEEMEKRVYLNNLKVANGFFFLLKFQKVFYQNDTLFLLHNDSLIS